MKYIKTYEQITTEITTTEELKALEDKYKIKKIDGFHKVKLNDITLEIDEKDNLNNDNN